MSEDTRHDRRKRILLKALQYLVGIAILGYVLQTVDWEQLFATTRRLSAGSLALVVALSALGMGFQFGTWHALAREVSDYHWSNIVRTDLIVRFVNSLLPSRVSGRSLAPAVLRHQTGASWPDATAVATAHTALYALCYAGVTFLGLVAGRTLLPSGLLLLLLLSGGLYLAAGLAIAGAGVAPGPFVTVVALFERLGAKVPVIGEKLASGLRSLGSLATDTAETFRRLLSSPRTVVRFVLGWSGASVLLPGVRFWVLLSAFGVSFEPLALLPVYLVMAYSVTVLPITPAGLGVTEATATAVFVALGLPREAVVAAVFIDRIVGVYLPALLGWYPLVRADIFDGKTSGNEGL